MLAGAVKFGDGLELDRDAYELRRAGRALKLERIPLDILFLLVEHRGQLVTREDIVSKIWGKDVFLDTDSSINGAIRKIRQALRDDPENPFFVQTVTGKRVSVYRRGDRTEVPGEEGGGKKVESANTTPQEYLPRTQAAGSDESRQRPGAGSPGWELCSSWRFSRPQSMGCASESHRSPQVRNAASCLRCYPSPT